MVMSVLIANKIKDVKIDSELDVNHQKVNKNNPGI